MVRCPASLAVAVSTSFEQSCRDYPGKILIIPPVSNVLSHSSSIIRRDSFMYHLCTSIRSPLQERRIKFLVPSPLCAHVTFERCDNRSRLVMAIYVSARAVVLEAATSIP